MNDTDASKLYRHSASSIGVACSETVLPDAESNILQHRIVEVLIAPSILIPSREKRRTTRKNRAN